MGSAKKIINYSLRRAEAAADRLIPTGEGVTACFAQSQLREPGPGCPRLANLNNREITAGCLRVVRRRPEIVFDRNLQGEAVIVVTLKHANLNRNHVRPNRADKPSAVRSPDCDMNRRTGAAHARSVAGSLRIALEKAVEPLAVAAVFVLAVG